MCSRRAVVLVAAVLCTAGGFACRAPVPQTATPAQRPMAAADSATQADNARVVQEILARIGERQTEPSEKVFQNVKWLTGIPARQFLSIMNGGYARALGVRCTYCHVETDFASEDKRPKRAAREMAVMHRKINQELQQMQNLQTPASQSRAINCATCHRGAIDPLGRR